jgi:ribosomal protein S6
MGVEDSLKKMGGEPLAVELWGKRKLSHYIDKQKYGTYVLLQFNGEGKCTGNFAVELEHNPNILAYLTTAIDQNDVLNQEEDLDTQIIGKTRETEKKESSKLKTETLSKDEGENNILERSDSEVSKQENAQDVETVDEEKNPEEEPSEVSLIDSSNEHTDTAEQESKDEESKHEEKEATDDNESLEKEESKTENADETSALGKEE